MTLHAEQTNYVPSEGRDSMIVCLEAAFEYCVKHFIEKIVIFTATGDGPLYVMEHLLNQPLYEGKKVIAVTPPAGKPYVDNPAIPGSPTRPPVKTGILNQARKQLLLEAGIAIHSAHLPLRPIQAPGPANSDLARISDALGILGGGFALCVQATMMACDAGEIDVGERICAVSADTAVIVLASRTETFLSPTEGLLVEHIICRPSSYNISKHNHLFKDKLWKSESALLPAETPMTVQRAPKPGPQEDGIRKVPVDKRRLREKKTT